MKKNQQSLTNKNLYKLFSLFSKKFPQEKTCIELLHDYIHNPNSSVLEEEVLAALIKIKK